MAEEIHGIKKEPLDNGDTTIEFKIIEDSKAFFDETESKANNKFTEGGFEHQIFGNFCEPKVEQYEESTMVGDPLTFEYQPFICDFSLLFKSTSEDGKMNNLQELTELGRDFLICCLHLLLEPESKEETTFETTTFETFKWIKENGKLQIGRAQLSKIINSWVASSTKSCQSDINLTENVWENTKSFEYESETKLIENDLKNTAQSKILKKSQQKSIKIHNNPPPKNKDKIAELKSLLKNQCGNHSIKSMADSLELIVTTVRSWIHRDKIVFQKHDGPCHFCDIQIQNMHKEETLDTKAIETALGSKLSFRTQKRGNIPNNKYQREIDMVKKQCGNHTMKEMAKTLKISEKTVIRWKKKYKITWYSSETVDCIFCKNTTVEKSNNSVSADDIRTKLYCNNCDFSSFNKKGFKKHNLEVHDILKPFVCTSCDYKSDRLQQLIRHSESVHEGKKPFKCTQCKAAYYDKGKLSDHIMSVHEGIKLYCHICVKSFAGRHTLNSHLRTVHADKPQAFKCKHCKNDSFLSRRGLLQHITSVHIQRKFQCTLCDKRFFKEINLKTHISVTHEGLKRFLCTICGRHFTENGKLRKHLEAVHEGKRPYKCSECDADFAYRQHMKTHIIAVHEKRKPHLCPTCGVGFADKSNCINHIAAVHEGKKRPMKNKQFL